MPANPTGRLGVLASLVGLRPKTVWLEGDLLSRRAAAVAAALDLQQDDRILVSLPLCQAFGLILLLAGLQVGAAVVLSARELTDPDYWLEAAAKGVTVLAFIPYGAEMVVRMKPARLLPASIRRVVIDGGELEEDTRVALEEALAAKQAELCQLYGWNETGGPVAVAERAPSDGRIRVRPLAEGSFAVPAPDDEGIGELVYEDAALRVPLEETGWVEPEGWVHWTPNQAIFVRVLGHRLRLTEVEELLPGSQPHCQGPYLHLPADPTTLPGIAHALHLPRLLLRANG